MEPSLLGAVASTRRLTPATFAGTAHIASVEGKGALPAGTYSPTALSAVILCPSHRPSKLSSHEPGRRRSWKA